MKNWRFYFGMIFGFAIAALVGKIEWAWYVETIVVLALFFAAEHIVHKIAVS